MHRRLQATEGGEGWHRNSICKVQSHEGGLLATRHGRVGWDHTVGTLARYLDGMGFLVPPDPIGKKKKKKGHDYSL